MDKLAMVIRDDGYDKLLTPFAFAQNAARQNVEVSMLFVLWAVRVLTPKGASAVSVEGSHACDEAWLRDRVGKEEGSDNMGTMLMQLCQLENVTVYGCRFAAETFNVQAQHLFAGVDGIVSPDWFLEHKAIPADHCQYF